MRVISKGSRGEEESPKGDAGMIAAASERDDNTLKWNVLPTLQVSKNQPTTQDKSKRSPPMSIYEIAISSNKDYNIKMFSTILIRNTK